MYCHLCRIDGSTSHESSSGHRAAKELAAVAVDRLSDHLAAAVDDDPSTPGSFENLDDFLKVKLPKAAKTDESKTKVFYCDSCNITLPVSDLKSHQRQKEHTLALFNEQTLEGLVGQYVDKEHRRLMLEPMREPQASVEESEAAKTYTCHLCALEVPLVFKYLHEWGLRHRACRALAAAAAKRARDQLRTGDKTKDESGDKSADKCEDESGDKSEDKPEDESKVKPKFSGKMMKKLLKLYAGKGVDEDIVEDADGEPEEQKCVKTKRLTAKGYFTDIIPYLSYVGTFHTVIVDDTEFVTLQIGRDTLKIHVNNYNGISYIERHGLYYMNCVLCDGFNTGYSSSDQQDKTHVMSLGHIKNLLSPIDNVHLIRKIDDTHAVCALCNVQVSRYQMESHILRDPGHTTALTEALERGKTYKDSKNHLKIMVYKPQVKANSQIQNKWNFGIPQAPKQNWGLFGAQPCFGAQVHQNACNSQVASCFGAQNKPGLYAVQNNAGFGSAPNSVGFGSAQKHAGFGGVQNNAANVGSAQNNAFFGNAQNTAFGGAPTTKGFGGVPNNTTSFGSVQNNAANFGSAQNNAFSASAQNTTGFGGAPINRGFDGVQNNAAIFGSAQNNDFSTSAQNTTGFGSAPTNKGFNGAQNNTAAFGSAQNNTAAFGSAQNNAATSGSAQNDAFFGNAQNTTVFGCALTNKGFDGVKNNAATFRSAQNNAFSTSAQNTTGFGGAPTNKGFDGVLNNTTPFGGAQNNSFIGSAQNNTVVGGAPTTKGFGGQINTASVGNALHNACGNKNLTTRFGEMHSNKNAGTVNTVLTNRFAQMYSIFGTQNKNDVVVATVKINTASDGVSDTTGFVVTNDSLTKLVANSQPSKQSTPANDKNSLASGLTKTESSEAADLKSPSEKSEKFTFLSNDSIESTQLSDNKSGNDAQSKNDNHGTAQGKPHLGKKNNNKRSMIHYSSSSSDSE